MAGEFIDLDTAGLDRMAKDFARMGGLFEDVLRTEYILFGAELELAMKALAPYDTGDLEDSISVDQPMIRSGEFEIKGGAGARYALRRHEEPYKSGKRPKYDDGAKFENFYMNGKGLGTRQKSSFRGFQPGRKFIENAVLAMEEDYNLANERIFDRLFEGGR